MSDERAPVFGEAVDLDLSDFKPKAAEVRGVAEQVGFHSREGVTQPAGNEVMPREPRRHRTGRNVQLNLKVRRETLEAFYKLADEHGWVLGEAFEHAVSALESQLRKDIR
jgi:hypothetical protein